MNDKEIITFKESRARDILYKKQDSEYTLIEKTCMGRRGTLYIEYYDIVIQRNLDGKYFKGRYGLFIRGDDMGELDWKYNIPTFTEVNKKEKTIFVYE